MAVNLYLIQVSEDIIFEKYITNEILFETDQTEVDLKLYKKQLSPTFRRLRFAISDLVL